MIKSRSIYHVFCDDCLRRKSIDTCSIEFALAALKQAGWKVDYDGGLLETICPSCAKKGETDARE